MKQTRTLLSKYQIRWAIIMINQKRVFKYQERELHKLGFVVAYMPKLKNSKAITTHKQRPDDGHPSFGGYAVDRSQQL